MTRTSWIVCALALAAASARAQSTPNIMAPKRSAQRAVAATTTHAEAMSSPSVEVDSIPGSGTRTVRGTAAGVSRAKADTTKNEAFLRETFSYHKDGRRDPFVSLMTNGELRPMIDDLRLTAIAFDPSGHGSVAVLRDVHTKDQYRVSVGQTLGRMRVANIRKKTVLFTIEEFGYSRQQELTLSDSTQVRTK